MVNLKNFGKNGRCKPLSARPLVVVVAILIALFGVARSSFGERGDFIAPVECEGYLLRLSVGDVWDIPAVVGVARSSPGFGLFMAQVEVDGYLVNAVSEVGESLIGIGGDLMARVEFEGYR